MTNEANLMKLLATLEVETARTGRETVRIRPGAYIFTEARMRALRAKQSKGKT